jgi:hypothetical protein
MGSQCSTCSEPEDIAQLRIELAHQYSKIEADLIIKQLDRTNYQSYCGGPRFLDLQDIKDYMDHNRRHERHLIKFSFKKQSTSQYRRGYYTCVFKDRYTHREFIETITASLCTFY